MEYADLSGAKKDNSYRPNSDTENGTSANQVKTSMTVGYPKVPKVSTHGYPSSPTIVHASSATIPFISKTSIHITYFKITQLNKPESLALGESDPKVSLIMLCSMYFAEVYEYFIT